MVMVVRDMQGGGPMMKGKKSKMMKGMPKGHKGKGGMKKSKKGY